MRRFKSPAHLQRFTSIHGVVQNLFRLAAISFDRHTNADVQRRQVDGSWRFVIDNPWGTD